MAEGDWVLIRCNITVRQQHQESNDMLLWCSGTFVFELLRDGKPNFFAQHRSYAAALTTLHANSVKGFNAQPALVTCSVFNNFDSTLKHRLSARNTPTLDRSCFVMQMLRRGLAALVYLPGEGREGIQLGASDPGNRNHVFES